MEQNKRRRLDNVVYMDEYNRSSMSKEQVQYWIGRAAAAGALADQFRELAEEQDRERESALRMAGMLPEERGLTEY